MCDLFIYFGHLGMINTREIKREKKVWKGLAEDLESHFLVSNFRLDLGLQNF